MGTGEDGRRLLSGLPGEDPASAFVGGREVISGLASMNRRPAVPTVSPLSKRRAAIEFIIDGGGAAITTGVWGDVEVPFGATIVGVRLFADQSGSIVVDIFKDSFANFPPTSGDTITASAKPTLSSATKSEDITLVGWKTGLVVGDILRFNVDSASTVQRVTVSLRLLLTSV